MVLKEIWIYPVKSLGGIRLDTASVKKKGLQHDRRWMLIDANGVAMTQRVHPAMARFKVRIEDNSLYIDYKEGGNILSSRSFSLMERLPHPITADVWGDCVEVYEVKEGLSEWFSDLLGCRCRLVVFPEENPRPVDEDYRVNSAQVSLADAYPFMIIGQASLDDLNRRLTEQVPMNRFRPNFVFEGGAAFAEDNWKNVSLGNLRFAAVKKCDRCVLITVNQDTGEKGTEPLRTLSSYRKVHNKVFFGQNLIALEEGDVSLGDRIIPM